MLMQLIEKWDQGLRGILLGEICSINFSPFIRRNESQIVVWAPPRSLKRFPG